MQWRLFRARGRCHYGFFDLFPGYDPVVEQDAPNQATITVFLEFQSALDVSFRAVTFSYKVFAEQHSLVVFPQMRAVIQAMMPAKTSALSRSFQSS